MRLVRPLLVGSLLALAVTPLAAQREANAVAKLEAARAANPSSVAALRALGVAYYKAQRYQDARTVLDQARRLDPKDGVSALYAGLSAEALGDITGARTAYNEYLRVGKTRRVKNQVSARLVALQRAEAIAAAKAAVANEAQISATPGSARTVAVPPFRYDGPDASLQPLERGIAELVITDLSRSSQLTVLERDRMQALSDEIRLSQSDRVDATTAVRAGKLMQAGRLVNGTMLQTGGQLRLGASVVNVATSESGQPASVVNSLDAIFAMEKQLVLEIFEDLGVTLTPAERQLVDQRPTNNLQAFLAYSRGLMASDDGRFEDAARFFETARSLDPNFAAANARFQAAQQAAAGTQVTAATIESSLGTTGTEGSQVTAASDGLTRPENDGIRNTLQNTLRDVNPSTITQVANDRTVLSDAPPPPQLDAPSNGTRIDQIGTTTGQVIIVVRRP